MSILVDVALLVVALAGTLVVRGRDVTGQALALGAFGVTLAALALILQAPDVALSLLVIGAAIVPLMVLLAIASGMKSSKEQER